MSGARADFIASLGKRVTEARELLGKLENNLGEGERDELIRRLRALGTSARLLQFPRVAEALAEAEATLDGDGGVSFRSVQLVGRILDDLPALAWDPADRPQVPEAPASAPEHLTVAPPSLHDPIGVPMTVLVVGPESVVELIMEESEARSVRVVECERTDDAKTARELARALAPDVLVLDATIEGADGLAEALLEDPLTEPMPIIVVGSLTKEAASRFLALGVQRTLASPYSGEVLMRTCEEVADQRHGRTARIPIGDPTVEQLGQRLADEVYRALVMGAAPSSRGEHVQLGEGAEVLAAIWGAIARVREIVTVRTGGSVRFAQQGPEGAMALAPWLDPETAGADRSRIRGRGIAADVRLEGRRVVVADDDPGVTWFIADLLRTTGCIVHEALDGKTALSLAQRVTPDLVVSDILMPELDGFALCRAMRRDVALRDVPVILLSWKEDLLQRVRELGASAAAYMRKESDARAILARVREVMWPRARIEARLKGSGEVRGRLEGITVRTLLEVVGTARGSARVTVRDASSLFEIEIRDGAPRRATQTSGDGSFARGERVLASMLGVGAGRFVVGPPSTGVGGELGGSLASMLEKPIASARGAIAALSGSKGVAAARVTFDGDLLETYLAATPEPMRGLVVRLAQGASPRELLLAGAFPATLLEDVLADLATRGAIIGVSDEHGADLLGPEVEDALAILKAAPPRAMPQRQVSRPPSRPPMQTPLSKPPLSRPPISRPPTSSRPALVLEQMEKERAQEAAPTVPASLADAVMREISERATGTATPVPPAAPIIEPEALKPRSNPPENETQPFELVRQGPLQSEPPVGGVPEDPDPTIEHTEIDADVAMLEGLESFPELAHAEQTEHETVYEAETLTPSDAPPARTPSVPVSEDSRPVLAKIATGASATSATGAIVREAAPVVTHKPTKNEAPAPAPASTGLGWFLLLAVLVFGGIFAKVVLMPSSSGPAYLDPPVGAELAPGQGMLEIAGPADSDVIVDGTPRGRGRVVLTLQSGSHEVRAGELTRTVDVAPGRLLKIDLAVP
jgi:DNA-binding response OmpR family regulator